MRGLLATALLAPALASAVLVVPTLSVPGEVGGSRHSSHEITHAVGIRIPLTSALSLNPPPHSFKLEVDLSLSGTECGTGDLVVGETTVPFGLTGEVELDQYQSWGLWKIVARWELTCGPLTRNLVFHVDEVNSRLVTDIGVSVLYSQNDKSLEIQDIKRYTRRPKAVQKEFLVDEGYQNNGQKNEDDQLPEIVPADKPSADDVDAVISITACDSVKCVFMVAVHHAKETVKSVKSKTKSMFHRHRCGGKHHKSHRPKCRPSHGRKHHDEIDAGHPTNSHEHEHEDCHDADAMSHHRGHGHGHHRHWHHIKRAAHPGLAISAVVLFAVVMFHIRRRSKRAAARAASGRGDCDVPRKRRGCLGWRRRRCMAKGREYSEKDEVLPCIERNPAYTRPGHIASEIADLRSAADAVDDIVSQSSDAPRYARRGSADTMETLPEYTTEETATTMGTEVLPGYSDSEESVSVADGYQPGTGEVWRARVDGVDVKA